MNVKNDRAIEEAIKTEFALVLKRSLKKYNIKKTLQSRKKETK